MATEIPSQFQYRLDCAEDLMAAYGCIRDLFTFCIERGDYQLLWKAKSICRFPEAGRLVLIYLGYRGDIRVTDELRAEMLTLRDNLNETREFPIEYLAALVALANIGESSVSSELLKLTEHLSSSMEQSVLACLGNCTEFQNISTVGELRDCLRIRTEKSGGY